MDYIKRILVLSQVFDGYSISNKRASAILRIEIENEIATMYLSTVNLKPTTSGEYHLFVLDENKINYDFHLGKRPIPLTKTLTKLPNIEKGLSAGICYIENNLPSLILFCCENGVNITDFKKLVADRCYEIIKDEKRESIKRELEQKPNKPYEADIEDTTNSTCEITSSQTLDKYNDEAVATENYYLKDDNLKDKLKIFEVLDNESVRIKNELPVGTDQEEAKKDNDNSFCFENETDNVKGKEYSKEHPYIDTARQELEDIFLKFPTESELEKSLPSSRWARINYSFDKYYVVGVIKENDKEKYICYGIPAKYSKEPPKELKGFCSFIPISIFDLNGDGYWMMFQDAITGECVKK